MHQHARAHGQGTRETFCRFCNYVSFGNSAKWLHLIYTADAFFSEAVYTCGFEFKYYNWLSKNQIAIAASSAPQFPKLYYYCDCYYYQSYIFAERNGKKFAFRTNLLNVIKTETVMCVWEERKCAFSFVLCCIPSTFSRTLSLYLARLLALSLTLSPPLCAEFSVWRDFPKYIQPAAVCMYAPCIRNSM